MSSSNLAQSETSKGEVHSTHLLHSHQVISKFVMNIAVVLTFGFAAPLLAVIITVDSLTNYYLWTRIIDRFINLHPANLKYLAINRLEAATAGSTDGLYSSWLLALVSVAGFWALFVFDMVGDVYGPRMGGLMIMVPVLAVLSVSLIPIYKQAIKRSITLLEFDGAVVLEMVSPMAEVNKDLNSKFNDPPITSDVMEEHPSVVEDQQQV